MFTCAGLLPSILLLLLLLMAIKPSSQQGERLTSCGGGASYQTDSTRPSNNFGAGLNSGAVSNRYHVIGMDMLVRNACAPVVPAEPATVKVFQGRYFIARCENCTKCPQELNNLRRVLTQIAGDAKMLSLLVVLSKDLVRPDTRQQPDTGLVKFVFSTDDDGLLTLCDPSDGDGESLKNFSKTSVLFVSISFIILIVISLAWLVFYYVQRFRYAHAKDRLQRRLFNAAKKALARIPTRPVKAGDKELSSDCPVCIDPYKPGDICRQLPCRHIFHKSCVDPWLLEHRTCPMCKSDILKAFGYHVSGRRRAQFSVNVEDDGPTGEQELNHRGDREDRLSIESTGSESANPFPAFTEVHDPFGFSPSASPQLIQMVNANGFQIIPLAVQNPHCEIIEAPIERHSTCGGDQTDGHTIEQQMTAAADQQKQQPTAQNEQQPHHSAGPSGLRLFRAVTGRRHVAGNATNSSAQQIKRSRSFSQSQISPLKIASGTLTNEANGTKGIIFSSAVNSGGDESSIRPNGGMIVPSDDPVIKEATMPTHSRAVTAPTGGGFRRKMGSSHGKQQSASGNHHHHHEESGEQRVCEETRVDMSGTL